MHDTHALGVRVGMSDLTQAVVAKIMVEETDHSVGSFIGEMRSVNEVIHLSGYCFTADPKQVNFLWT